MKYRNQFLKYKLNCHMSPEGGAGGGEGGAASGDGTADAGNSAGNNSDNNLITYDDLWNTNADDTGSADTRGQNANASANAGQAPSADQQFQQHIDGIDFTNGMDLNAGMEAIRTGDMEGFGKMMRQVGVNAYKHALIDANKVVQQRVESMGATIKNDVSASQATSNLVNQMQSDLPFTKSPAYAPVAKLVLTQMLEKGKSPTEAIKEVGKYFQGMANEVGKLKTNPPGGRPQSGFGGATQDADGGNTGEEPDWLSILGGPAQ